MLPFGTTIKSDRIVTISYLADVCLTHSVIFTSLNDETITYLLSFYWIKLRKLRFWSNDTSFLFQFLFCPPNPSNRNIRADSSPSFKERTPRLALSFCVVHPRTCSTKSSETFKTLWLLPVTSCWSPDWSLVVVSALPTATTTLLLFAFAQSS